MFVTKYYHHEKNSFIYHLTHKGKIVGDKRISQFKRVLYVYKSETIRVHIFDDNTQVDWFFLIIIQEHLDYQLEVLNLPSQIYQVH